MCITEIYRFCLSVRDDSETQSDHTVYWDTLTLLLQSGFPVAALAFANVCARQAGQGEWQQVVNMIEQHLDTLGNQHVVSESSER